jgi:hypothetical protein
MPYPHPPPHGVLPRGYAHARQHEYMACDGVQSQVHYLIQALQPCRKSEERRT